MVVFTCEDQPFLRESSPSANPTVFERFRAVLNEGIIGHRVQYMIEVPIQAPKAKYKDDTILPEGLDVFDKGKQITHETQLEGDLKVEEGLGMVSYLLHQHSFK